ASRLRGLRTRGRHFRAGNFQPHVWRDRIESRVEFIQLRYFDCRWLRAQNVALEGPQKTIASTLSNGKKKREFAFSPSQSEHSMISTICSGRVTTVGAPTVSMRSCGKSETTFSEAMTQPLPDQNNTLAPMIYGPE